MLAGIAVSEAVIRRRLHGKLHIFQRPFRLGVLPAAHHLPIIGAPSNTKASGELVVLFQNRLILGHGDLRQVLHHVHAQLGDHQVGVNEIAVPLDLGAPLQRWGQIPPPR